MYLQHFTEGDSRGIGHVVMAIFLVIPLSISGQGAVPPIALEATHRAGRP
jgi:hypothetical protein